MRIYCIFSQEAIKLMGGNRGKLAAQAGHAYLHSFWDAQDRFPDAAATYRDGLTRKICLVVPTTEELVSLYDEYRDQYPSTLVKDSGFTVFEKPTITCVGIGPCERLDINAKVLL
jgi:peptidyl-tRNA hydrolase